MVLKKKFQSQPSAIPSLDFVEIATGIGYVTYFAGQTSGLNILSTNAFYSDRLKDFANINTTSYTAFITKDFDIVLTVPQTVEGPLIVNVPIALKRIGGTDNAHNTFIVAKLFKVDGVTAEAVEIIEGGSAEWTTDLGAVNQVVEKVHMARMDVPRTHFKEGDTLRLRIIVYGRSPTTINEAQVAMAFDPQDRVSIPGEPGEPLFVSGTTVLSLNLPQRVDL